MSFNQIPCPFIIPFSTRAHNSQVLPYILWNIRSLLFLQDFFTQFFRLVYHVELRNRLFFACTMNNTKITINSFAQFLHDTFGGTFIFKRDYRTHLQYTDISWISRIFSQNQNSIHLSFSDQSSKTSATIFFKFVMCIIIHGRTEFYPAQPLNQKIRVICMIIDCSGRIECDAAGGSMGWNMCFLHNNEFQIECF